MRVAERGFGERTPDLEHDVERGVIVRRGKNASAAHPHQRAGGCRPLLGGGVVGSVPHAK